MARSQWGEIGPPRQPLPDRLSSSRARLFWPVTRSTRRCRDSPKILLTACAVLAATLRHGRALTRRKADEEQHDEYHEEDLRHRSGGSRYHAKSQDRGDQRNDEKGDCPTQHNCSHLTLGPVVSEF